MELLSHIRSAYDYSSHITHFCEKESRKQGEVIMPGQTGGDPELTSSQPQQASAQNQRVAAKNNRRIVHQHNKYTISCLKP